MKKIFLIVALLATAFVPQSFTQENIKSQPSPVLTSYLNLKDALVKSNAEAAVVSATELITLLNAADIEIVNADSLVVALTGDAAAISNTTDLKVQREKFATLSANMLVLAKTVKLSANPVYLQYCPMKKASWLSDDKAIKNPYYGTAMLTCGSVKETF